MIRIAPNSGENRNSIETEGPKSPRAAQVSPALIAQSNDVATKFAH